MPKRNTVRPRILVIEGLWNDTADLVELAGGYPREVSPWRPDDVKRELLTNKYHGILLTGGSDVNPELYGQKPHPTVYGIDHMRDAIELFALNYARQHDLAVLGICRGSQIMCVSSGGQLVQDIESYLKPIHAHRHDDHPVYAAPDARTFRRACQGTMITATSLHHQCVRRPGRGMRVAARAVDGTVEAIESKDGRMLGVQFHPELSALNDEQAFSIFRWLVQTAAARAGGRAPRVNFREAVDLYWDLYTTAASAAAESAGTPVCTTSPAWADDDIIEATASPPRKPRQAGEPSIPSMRELPASTREMVTLIESSTGTEVTVVDDMQAALEITEQRRTQRQLEESVLICPECHLRFDLVEDRDDHCKYVHPQPPFVGAQERFPELGPPPGHPDWDDDEDETERLLRENGFDPRDWEDWS